MRIEVGPFVGRPVEQQGSESQCNPVLHRHLRSAPSLAIGPGGRHLAFAKTSELGDLHRWALGVDGTPKTCHYIADIRPTALPAFDLDRGDTRLGDLR